MVVGRDDEDDLKAYEKEEMGVLASIGSCNQGERKDTKK